jgi:hypothetical protein
MTMRLVLLIAALVLAALPATAQQAGDEAKIRTLISDWYAIHAGADARPHYTLLAPGAIDAGPGWEHIDTGRRSLGPTINRSLAARALKFEHDVDALKIDARLAKAQVWERGYFYAWAVQKTYESAASALFVLEKQDDGRWLILAYEARSVGIPPSKVTDPMPDLRDLYYSTCASCDPEADARAGNRF